MTVAMVALITALLSLRGSYAHINQMSCSTSKDVGFTPYLLAFQTTSSDDQELLSSSKFGQGLCIVPHVNTLPLPSYSILVFIPLRLRWYGGFILTLP